MPADVAVSDDGELFLELQTQRVQLSPGEGFALAQRLIRGATQAIVIDEADRALVRDVIRGEIRQAQGDAAPRDHGRRGDARWGGGDPDPEGDRDGSGR